MRQASPGVKSIIKRIRAQREALSPKLLVDACLDLMGPLMVSESTRQALVSHAAVCGDVPFGADDEADTSDGRVN